MIERLAQFVSAMLFISGWHIVWWRLYAPLGVPKELSRREWSRHNGYAIGCGVAAGLGVLVAGAIYRAVAG